MNKIFLLMIVGLVGCTTTKVVEKRVPVPVELNLPEKPPFPKIMNSEVECLTESTQKQFLARDMVMRAYIHELEDTILSTHTEK